MATLQLHPNVVPLVGQAQVTARGSFPQLMVNPDHSLLKYAVWMTQQANFGPNGEDNSLQCEARVRTRVIPGYT